ncbi:hypothetical protein V4D30_05240 [Thermodesulfovibrio sp. 3907-1M]|uniref:Transposase n=1 Tax=Thermodesulfovibrio autotrophicus TaxID=3118333 RepID=A0AAU8GUK0_9BACT
MFLVYISSEPKEAGLLPANTRKYKRRQRRPPSSKEGEIIFLDGSLHEGLLDGKPYTQQGPTHFQRAICELGIGFIYANSP